MPAAESILPARGFFLLPKGKMIHALSSFLGGGKEGVSHHTENGRGEEGHAIRGKLDSNLLLINVFCVS